MSRQQPLYNKIQLLVSKMKQQNLIIIYLVAANSLLSCSCSSPLIKVSPEHFSDTSTITITGNAASGNKGLLGFKGPVFVHVGLITDSSVNPNQWRYVKFKWGSTEEAARAIPAGDNRWNYTIPNIREFFGVKQNEKIERLAILFREGNCVDTFCRVLRNLDKSDLFIPIDQEK